MPDYHLAIAAIGTAELLLLGILFAVVVMSAIIIALAIRMRSKRRKGQPPPPLPKGSE